MPAIPFIVGGLSLAGSVAGKASQGRAEGRLAETEALTRRDQTAADLYRTQQDAALRQRDQGLNERKFASTAPDQKLSQLIRGDILANAQDPKISVPGIQNATVTGGLRPSMFSAEARGGGNTLVQQALEGLMKGEQFDPMTLLTPPSASPLPQPGKLDKFLNILGGVGSAAGALAPLIPGQSPASTPGITPRLPLPGGVRF